MQKQLDAISEDIAKLDIAINALSYKGGENTQTSLLPPSTVPQPKQSLMFYGGGGIYSGFSDPLIATRKFLESQHGRPASIKEIYTALFEGGFRFNPSITPSNQHRGLSRSILYDVRKDKPTFKQDAFGRIELV